MKSLFIVICFLSQIVWAQSSRSGYRPMPVGSDSVSTAFENLSCTQMIGNFLSYIGSSGLGQSGINERFRKCLAKSRSGVLGAAASALRITTDNDLACLETANQEQRRYENAKDAFINSLSARENIYNLKNISNKNLLSQCSSSQQAGLVRRPSEPDLEYTHRAMFNCGISKDVQSFRYNSFRQAYANSNDFAEYEVCYNYRVEYGKEKYPPMRVPSNSNSATPEPTASREPRCQPLTCEQVMLPYAVNNPSPCYRNKVIDCNVNGYVNTGGGKTNNGSGVSTGN